MVLFITQLMEKWKKAMTRLRFIQNKTKFKVEVFVLVVLKGASRLDFEEKLKISPFLFHLK